MRNKQNKNRNLFSDIDFSRIMGKLVESLYLFVVYLHLSTFRMSM